MKGMAKSKIGYTGIGADGRPVDWYYGWNPGGFGCSGGCDGCWSKRMSARSKCPDCAAFKVHMHPERLGQPEATRKPGVVLVNFTCDTFDGARPRRDVLMMLANAATNRGHVYVWLTKNAERMASEVMSGKIAESGPDYWGLTIRNQADADAKLRDVLAINGRLWLSLEPLWGPMDIQLVLGTNCHIQGVIVGHDNRRGAPGTDTLAHVRSVVKQCQAAGVAVYVKQIWMWECGWCHWQHEEHLSRCKRCGRKTSWSRPHLREKPAMFPVDLRLRNLPWPAPRAEARP